jgi:hypothetical protein
MLDEPRFGPIDLMQMRLSLQLAPHQRVRLRLEVRELAGGLVSRAIAATSCGHWKRTAERCWRLAGV